MHTVATDEFTGYTFEITEEPNSTGHRIICTAYNDKHEAVTSATSAYGNGSGYGYAKMGAIEGCKANLQALIDNNFNMPKEEPYDLDFLYRINCEYYIAGFGELGSNGELVILMDSWEQVEGADEREYIQGQGMVKTGNFKKSVYAKLVDLAKKNLLKPSINRTILEVEYVFTDEYDVCDRCGKVYNRTWDTIQYVESAGEVLCADCINEDDDVITGMIDEASENFRKALPVEISEEAIERLGYVKVSNEQDFSTRFSSWGEEAWGAYNTPIDVVERVCKMYGGFPKLTGVWQFDCEYTLYFPADTVNYARLELGLDTDEDFIDDREKDED